MIVMRENPHPAHSGVVSHLKLRLRNNEPGNSSCQYRCEDKVNKVAINIFTKTKQCWTGADRQTRQC